MRYFVLIASLLMANIGCAAQSSGSLYEVNETRSLQAVLTGTVEDVREVDINESSTLSETTGAATGAALGGLLGNQIGKGGGKTAATVLLGLVGGLVGNKVEERMNTELGLEFIISLDDGQIVAVSQAADKQALMIEPGDRVRIVLGEHARIIKLRSQRKSGHS